MASQGFLNLFCCLFLVLYLSTSVAATDPEVTSGLLREFIRRMEHLEQRDLAQQQDIITLKHELSQERESRRQLENTVKALLEELSRPNTDSNEVNDKLTLELNGQSNLWKPTSTWANKSDNAETKHMLKGHPRTRQTQRYMSVAFCATLGSHQTHIGANQSIVFDNVITNVGNAYNSHIGIFIAPVSGTYAFSVTLTTLINMNSHYDFAVNGKSVSKIYVRGSESPSQSASQTIVLHMTAFDDVFIRNEDSDKSLNGGSYSSFTGFLIQEDDPTSPPVPIGK